jgi:DNA-binding IclR family transcriptional regulator
MISTAIDQGRGVRVLHGGLPDDKEGRGASSVVEKVVTLLDAFSSDRTGYGVSELARRSNLPKATTHRLLGLLQRCGVVAREGDGYQWGERMHEIADRLDCRHAARLRRELLSFAADAYALTRHTVHLVVLTGATGRVLDTLGHQRDAVEVDDTDEVPLHCTAAGKVLLAYAPDPVRRQVLGGQLTARTAATVTSGVVLATELNKVRRAGLATTRHEYVPGVSGLAAPIFDSDRTVVAALSVVGPTDRIDIHTVAGIVTRIGQAASRTLRSGTVPTALAA